MATIKSSKARKSNPARKSSTGNAASSAVARPRSPTIMNAPVKAPIASYVSMLPADAHPDIVQLAQRADELTGATAEAQAKRAERERQRAEREARERAGVSLRGPRLEQARNTIGEINLSAVAIHGLAMEAQDCPDNQEWLIFAMQRVAETVCRRCDVLSELVGDLGAGNFADAFSALTEEEAARIEAEASHE